MLEMLESYQWVTKDGKFINMFDTVGSIRRVGLIFSWATNYIDRFILLLLLLLFHTLSDSNLIFLNIEILNIEFFLHNVSRCPIFFYKLPVVLGSGSMFLNFIPFLAPSRF